MELSTSTRFEGYLQKAAILAESHALHLAGLYGIDELTVPPVVALRQLEVGTLFDHRGTLRLGLEVHAACLLPLIPLCLLCLQAIDTASDLLIFAKSQMKHPSVKGLTNMA